MPSRIVGLYPSKDLNPESLALALFQFFVTYGVVDVLVTDPGSNIDSAVTKLLLSWFGIRLQMSLVHRHQSNGVERTHREVLKFLSMLVADERISGIWSRPHVIGIVQFIVNSQISGETGKSPFDYLFGTLDAKWLRLPEVSRSKDVSSGFLKALDESIKDVRDAAYQVVSRVQAKRLQQAKNLYQVGDMVLLNAKAMGIRSSKLAPTFMGPYTVTKVHKADVLIKHLATEDSKEVHMEHLKPFFSDSYDEAYKAALVDFDQFVVDEVLQWAGDPETRTGMTFLHGW
jgi:hypothetical protein